MSRPLRAVGPEQYYRVAEPRGVSLRYRLLACVLLVSTLVAPIPARARPLSLGQVVDPAAIVGPRQCGECHEPETDVWQASRHYLGGKLLARDPRAQAIARALGISRIKSDRRCTACHFTVQQTAATTRAISGVSCESCHGGAGSWLDLHDDFGADDATPQSESDEHRAQRYSRCDDAGMHRAGRVRDLAAQCFACHTIADEELVNTGGHSSGAGFELVAWSQGGLRHNFIRGGGVDNAESSQARRRMMYVVGQGLDLAYSLRALAGVREDGAYKKTLLERARSAIAALERIEHAAPTAELKWLLGAASSLDIAAAQNDDLVRAAQRVAAAIERFEAGHDGELLTGLDVLVPGDDDYHVAAVQ